MKTHINLVKALRNPVKTKKPLNKFILALNVVAFLVIFSMVATCIILAIGTNVQTAKKNDLQAKVNAEIAKLDSQKDQIALKNKLDVYVKDLNDIVGLIAKSPRMTLDMFLEIEACAPSLSVLTLRGVTFEQGRIYFETKIAVSDAGTTTEEKEAEIRDKSAIMDRFSKNLRYGSRGIVDGKNTSIFSATSSYQFDKVSDGFIIYNFVGELKSIEI